MVTHSVVYVVLVEEQESVAPLAAAFTVSTLWTAATASPFPSAAEVLLAGAGAVAGSGMTVVVVAASEGQPAAPLAWPPDPPGNQPVLLASWIPPVG